MREPDYLTRRQTLPILAGPAALAPASPEPEAALKAAAPRLEVEIGEVRADIRLVDGRPRRVLEIAVHHDHRVA